MESSISTISLVLLKTDLVHLYNSLKKAIPYTGDVRYTVKYWRRYKMLRRDLLEINSEIFVRLEDFPVPEAGEIIIMVDSAAGVNEVYPHNDLDILLAEVEKALDYVELMENAKANQSLEYLNHNAPCRNKVFIGHGRSQVWRDLKELLHERLNLEWEEFNREPAAGKSTKERLEEMLSQSGFAFLIMTAEDEHADQSLHARENVIHEVGLFQGRLGFNRAIVLLEDGCKEFSNIQGLVQIRFPQNNIRAVSEDIRRVLEREGILNTVLLKT